MIKQCRKTLIWASTLCSFQADLTYNFINTLLYSLKNVNNGIILSNLYVYTSGTWHSISTFMCLSGTNNVIYIRV